MNLWLNSDHLTLGEMICKNTAELDDKMYKITNAFPDMMFHVRFSQGALGKYTREIDSPKLLFKLGYQFNGYIGDSDRMFYNSKFNELIVIDENRMLTRYKLY